jgi:YgiT-type zinc finger domain-containing protein
METCYFCRKGILEDKKATVDFRWGDKLIVIEGVPAKVCSECGEKYYSAEVSKQMEKIAIDGKEEETIEVPLVRLSEVSSPVEANK